MVRLLGIYRYPAQAAKALQDMTNPRINHKDPVNLGGTEWFYRVMPEGDRWALRAYSADEFVQSRKDEDDGTA